MNEKWYLMDENRSDESSLVDILGVNVLDEIMSSGIRDRVVVYNSDLASGKEIDCIMQGKAADTYLKSMERNIICHPGSIVSGQYVFDGKEYWIAIGYPDSVYGVYEKCCLLLCQYYMKWQNAEGKIIGRWVNVSSASKYDVGQTQTQDFIVSTNNYSLILPSDSETNQLYDARVFIDNSTPPYDVYKITRDDSVLYQYPDVGACLTFITSKDEFNSMTDNQEYGICNYISKDISSNEANISGSKILYYGLSNTYTISNNSKNLNLHIDPNETHVEWDLHEDGSVTVKTKNMEDIGLKFYVQVVEGDSASESLTVTINNLL